MLKGHGSKESIHGSTSPVGVSIHPIAPQRPSRRGSRERSAPNANRRLFSEGENGRCCRPWTGSLGLPSAAYGTTGASRCCTSRQTPSFDGSAKRFRRLWARLSKPQRRRRGRPRTGAELRRLIEHMVAANPLWRAPRIHGELKILGIAISERTVSRL